MNLLQRAARLVNTVVSPLARSGRLGPMTEIGYVGRRSGREVRLPVAFLPEGDGGVIRVELPDRKTWWRNFTGEGAPLWVRVAGADRPGHGVAVRDGRQVRVDVRFG
ncbi:hypothetical protein [Pseudonocardia oroxyli]|uniref:Deazaflavin-dependent oxidoreductase, nitroreductase family n=1 Tax=Pseudonocardia oroxyli TaxID=366584 RepID=A0A1G7VLC4_PSEOR|nr:hypothetical protein [Pseudonocardia oroxyli]SDG60626.1 hypothetical protein SAMN05216377_11398 [Pseudonocardia oroxyli]